MAKKKRSAKSDKKVLASSTSLFAPSMNAFTKNLPTFIILLALPFLVTLSNYPNGMSDNNDMAIGTPVILVIIFGIAIFLIIYLILGALTTKLQLEAAKGKVVSLRQLWASTKSRIVTFGLLCIAIAALVTVGLIAFIIPGIIFIRRYVMAPYILLDNDDMTISEAMNKSAEMSKPYSGYILGVVGILILLSFTTVIPITGPILSFALTSIYGIALPLRYLEIKKLDSGHSQRKTRKAIK